MPTTYTCAICGKTTDDPTGWGRFQIVQTHYTSAQPSVSADDALHVLDVDSADCLAQMQARLGVTP